MADYRTHAAMVELVDSVLEDIRERALEHAGSEDDYSTATTAGDLRRWTRKLDAAMGLAKVEVESG